MTKRNFKAGAAQVDISPQGSVPLAGYPFVSRMSTGVYDPLLATAIYISDGVNDILFIGVDLIFVSKQLVNDVRKAIETATSLQAKNILISATHTHSSPVTVRFAAGGHDANLAAPDPEYLSQVASAMVKAATSAISQADDVTLGITIADATGIGTNRQDPSGPADLNVPVLWIRRVGNDTVVALMAIVNMHPTVLREDSKIVSGDFPGIARQILQHELLGRNCPVLFHLGASGDQSPRHVTKANTLSEAERIARILFSAIKNSSTSIEYAADISITTSQEFVALVRKIFPPKESLLQLVEQRSKALRDLRESAASKQQIRLAEVNWFGAVELAYLKDLSENGALDEVYNSCLPAEIQIITIAQWTFISWPGEVFIEYALALKKHFKNTFVITLANGELQGYIVTKTAAEQGGYEASNAIFDYRSGDELVTATLRALQTEAYGSVSGN